METNSFLRIFKTIVGLVGVCDNFLVCVVIYKVPFMHGLTNALIFHQAAVDLFGSLVLILASNVPVPEHLSSTPADWILCRVWIGNLFLWGAFNTSTLNLLSITMERFFAVMFPFKYSRFFTRRLIIILISVSWVIGVGEQAIYIAVGQDFVDGRCSFGSSTTTRMFGALFIFVKFFIPVLIMLFAYITIMYNLLRSGRRIATMTLTHPSSTGPDHEATPAQANSETPGGSLLRASRNTFKTLLLVFVSYFVCWAPNQIIFFLFNLGWPLDFTSVVYIISVGLVAVNSCINPIIYGFKYRRFRQAVRKLLGLKLNEDFATTA